MSMNKTDFHSKVGAARVERVEVEGAGVVCLRPMALRARFDIQALVQDGKLLDAMCASIAATLCDESGALLFSDAGEIASLDGALMERVATEAMRVSGFDSSTIEDAAKN